MHASPDRSGDSDLVRALAARVERLEARLDAVEAGSPARRSSPARSDAASSGAGLGDLSGAAWATPYETAQLEVSETWIELHEPSARPQLQRLIRQVVDEEGPVTERLSLDRVRRAWGLKRAGGRVQEAFEQALRQLVARGLVLREGDALVAPGSETATVRVPTDDEASRRGAEDVPITELALALTLAARGRGLIDVDDLTMQVAKLFGWTRRGGAIQERLDAALEHALAEGALERSGDRIGASYTSS